ncbi:hypothetical protein G3N57_04450, partial [Paraburkholderia sp. Se-20369]|nr:hypothetical protein [Paraburkholderia sp. Se-20369]
MSTPSVIATTAAAAAPVGIFDSGLGGLSVLRAVRAQLPEESFIYVADSHHAPYGPRDEAFITERTLAIGEWLAREGTKALVVACNTATARAIAAIREHLSMPLVGVEPGIKPAVAASASGIAGVLATQSTLNSPRFQALLDRYGDGRRFYDHHGIDWRRTLGAALHTFSGDRQGGSTITQQLARNLYPDEVGRAPTLTRKLKELVTAFKIESVYSKDQILETYLNTVPFLYNAYGVEMAARTYFDKSAAELDILESATLVGMLKANSYYNPVLNPERAVQRRNTVLAQMNKYGKLKPAAYAWLIRQPLRVDFEPQTASPGLAPHFTAQLRKWLIAWADRNNYNIYTDGLVVRTTIDSRLQQMATQAVEQQTDRLQEIADDAWRGADGCGLRNELFRGFIRQTPDYRSARDAGATDPVALRRLASNRPFMRALCRSKTQV